MQRATQLSVSLQNEPRRLAELCRTLADAEVNILAVSVLDSTEQSVVRLIVDKPDEASQALAAKSFMSVGTPVLVLNLANEVGALSQTTRKLGTAGLNINYVYGSASDAGEGSFIVIAVSDIDRAERALSQAD